MFLKRSFPLSICAASLIFSSVLLAQEVKLPCDEVEDAVLASTPGDMVELVSSIQEAEVIKRINPKYPPDAALKGGEGWVKMSYVIDTDGNVKDPIVEDSGGHPKFRKEALRAIKRWKYSPAMKDGQPTEQCHSAVRFDFTLDQKPGARRAFIEEYQEAVSLVEQKNYEDADKVINALHKGANNRYENAWLWSIDARLAELTQDHARELQSIIRIIDSAKVHDEKYKTFDHAYNSYLHSRKFLLEASFAKYANALETLESIKAMDNADVLLKNLEDTIATLDRILASEKPIFVEAKMSETEVFHHNLSRNKFGFANIDGDLSTVEVRCDAKRMKYTIAADHVWEIPKSWGQCRIIVSGDEDTSFSIAEVVEV